MEQDDDNVEDENFEIDIDDIGDNTLVGNNSNSHSCTSQSQETYVNKDVCVGNIIELKSTILQYLENINVNNELIKLLNENINLVISKELGDVKEFSSLQPIGTNSKLIKSTQTFLSHTTSLYKEINKKDNINNGFRNKFKRFKKEQQQQQQDFEKQYKSAVVHPENIQVNASKKDLENRIRSFNRLKKHENTENNVIEFRDEVDNENNYSSRTISIPESKIQKSTTFNSTGPLDQFPSDPYATANQNQTSYINERLDILENHLKITVPRVPKDIYQRVKSLEDKLMIIEDSNPLYFKRLYDEANQKNTSNITIPHQ
ncbi:hypothetical protein CYY_000023 [Polysphondylium violaceum]|uniref:Uncharacterized protein n=1 Tax=Polysphondylium violaceum TaxID=133409 RepID=A0A8J4Q4N8_9MYCE|nr:hypothetical protein CYY_000023 [Polysphondylium violaceum]